MASIPQQDINLVESSIQYSFRSPGLLAWALNASGAKITFTGRRWENNKRLAIHGDAVMKAMLSQRWVRTNLSRGDWDAIWQDKLSNSGLNEAGERLGLHSTIHGELPSTPVSSKMMATAVEAIVGAVHLDGGDQAAYEVMIPMGLVDNTLKRVTPAQLPT